MIREGVEKVGSLSTLRSNTGAKAVFGAWERYSSVLRSNTGVKEVLEMASPTAMPIDTAMKEKIVAPTLTPKSSPAAMAAKPSRLRPPGATKRKMGLRVTSGGAPPY